VTQTYNQQKPPQQRTIPGKADAQQHASYINQLGNRTHYRNQLSKTKIVIPALNMDQNLATLVQNSAKQAQPDTLIIVTQDQGYETFGLL
jgi:hypothetical protein